MSTQHQQEKKEYTARLSVISNTLLLILKFVVGFSLGSVAIISEAIHSGMDLIAAIVAFFSVKKSAEPPDKEHAFGHGKYEDISGLFESILIFVAALLIIYESVSKLISGESEPLDPVLLYAGIGVMGISALVNWLVSSRLMKVAKETESIALESDAWHLRTDVYTSAGVFAGLILIQLTGFVFLDAVVAIGVAFVIIRAAYDLSIRSYRHLIDHRLTDEEESRIKRVICEHTSEYVSFHNLRTRRAGPEVFIEFHLVLDGKISVEQAHDLTDHLESDINLEFPRSTVTIHVEPCTHSCKDCTYFCDIRKDT